MVESRVNKIYCRRYLIVDQKERGRETTTVKKKVSNYKNSIKLMNEYLRHVFN